MFRGHHNFSIDQKGRLSIPIKFRDYLSGKNDSRIMITYFEGCLISYPMQEWENLETKFLQLPQFKPAVRNFVRTFLSPAEECLIDKHGRILIPQTLRQMAKLEKDVLIMGMLNCFEIWNPVEWEVLKGNGGSDSEELQKFLEEYGI